MKALLGWTELELEGSGVDFVSDGIGQMYFFDCFYWMVREELMDRFGLH